MTRHEAHRIREEMLAVKVWLEHFQDDRACNLIPTESSLILAKSHADSALTLLERMEAEQKETA
ncbi:hypothetical protein [Mesorhizobium sp. B2-1-3A]|uniref:hypothetical protein n=1 Tax=Mesorhizobium sp. B2-1-3A TaxID=2589971 RepID=UPI00112A0E70|nr:hypothetical protein [Mesorhizobium sp. B2-1-3A]TPM89834.1 hypothetical protein FJ977_35220 [Mesorhizobium sp. B2-1-3A]